MNFFQQLKNSLQICKPFLYLHSTQQTQNKMNQFTAYYDLAFERMPSIFTSSDFAKQLRNVIPAGMRPHNNHLYLDEKCERMGDPHRNKLWQKKGKQQSQLPLIESNTVPTLEYCIKRCKDAGLSVRKIEQTFIDL